MSNNRFNPPRLAIWWLRHACPSSDDDALTGDLIERFREGQTRSWFWRQVLIAFALGVPGEIRRHWPHFCYAIAGATLPEILFRGVKPVPIGWWTNLPEPWEHFVLLLGLWAQLVLTALPVLAAGLVIGRMFRWVSLLRTALISLALITLGHYVFAPGSLQMLTVMLFSSFLVATWLGCLSPRKADEFERQRNP
jgi:hypothetical protein